jgi:anthranilate synthase component 2
MKVLVFDNYDSFTYNLVHCIEKLIKCQPEVYRNNKISLNEIECFDKIVLSPGPGVPSEAGILLDVIKKYSSTKSILGVCLGMQAICEAFGGTIINLEHVFHGVATQIEIASKKNIFKNIPGRINVGRYHSWVADKNNFPAELEITSVDEYGNIMSLQHKKYNVHGVQFHPESVLTESGEEIIKNWLEL